jgi:hypothetical protein
MILNMSIFSPLDLLFGLMQQQLLNNYLGNNMERLFALVLSLCTPNQPIICHKWTINYNLTYEECNRQRKERDDAPELSCVEVRFTDV